MLKNVYTAIALVAVLLLLAPAAYADEKTTTGQFQAASVAPIVDAIEIYTDIDCTSPASAMDPLTTYYALVTISSNNNIKQLQTVRVTLFYDSAGNDPNAPVIGNPQTCAILSRTVGGATWTIDAGGSTTWQIVPGSCQEPSNLNVKTGSWRFAFIPGKVATESPPGNWDAQGWTVNKQSQSAERYVRDKHMNWYGEVASVGPALVDWGTVPLGLTFDVNGGNGNPQTNIAVTYISNGNYSEDIRSTDWTGGSETVYLDETVAGNGPPADPGKFALKAYATNTLGSAIVVETGYEIMRDTGTITAEAGNTVETNTLWLSLSSDGIAPEIYSGAVYYQISNR